MEKEEPQSVIFAGEEANSYFERNGFKRGFLPDFVVSRFPKEDFSHFDIAEFGIGAGQNLMMLKNFANRCHGYDVSEKGVKSFSKTFSSHPERELFHAQEVNLCEPFTTPVLYDLIIYGFFAYYVTDSELSEVKKNLLQALKPGGYLFVYDFLARESVHYPDKRNPKLNVYKRNLSFWLNHFSEFDLIDFRLFDNDKIHSNRHRESHAAIDMQLPSDDMNWNFGALFTLRS
ncbi:class I SAM-dependent methyltransferase [bacterium]|nr:class I SAM-dependent methyltransferase [bacterium]